MNSNLTLNHIDLHVDGTKNKQADDLQSKKKKYHLSFTITNIRKHKKWEGRKEVGKRRRIGKKRRRRGPREGPCMFADSMRDTLDINHSRVSNIFNVAQWLSPKL